MSGTLLQTRRWTRLEYDRLIELGIIQEDEHLELLGGQLILRDRQTPAHATGIRLAQIAFAATFTARWHVRVLSPIALDDESEPEPDLSVVPGDIRDYLHAHPTRPALLVEVADTSLAFDREFKGSLYARAEVPEYWITNLVEHVLEIYRQPTPDTAARFGWTHRYVERLGHGDRVAPLVAPEARIAVADLLP